MSNVELIVGPAGAGKTAHVLSEFRDELRAAQTRGEFGTGVWITPTQRARRAVAGAITHDDLPVCFAPHVVTFDEFAERLLRTASATIRPISQITKKKLLRDLIDQLAGQKRLPYFEAVASTPGFLELCVSFISELKREEIWPEHFLEAHELVTDASTPARTRRSSKEAELGLIYSQYQEMLHRGHDGPNKVKTFDGHLAGLYDAEGRFWSARTLLKGGHCGPFNAASLVVVDGFTDFTRTQYEILGELGQRSQRLLITLPMDSEGGRKDLFGKTYAALEELRRVFQPCTLTVSRLDLSSAKKRSVLGHLSSHLFDNPRLAPRFPNSDRIRVLSCIRTTGEITEVARRIKKLLLEGTSPDDVVVAFHSLERVADLVRDTFLRVGVPAAIEVGHSIAATGPVRIAFLVLDVEREDWAFPQLMTLLNSPLLRPSWPDCHVKQVSKFIGAFLRQYNIDRGREVILNSMQYELNRQESGDPSPDLLSASESLNTLSDILAPLRERATFGEWVDIWLGILDELGVPPSADDVIVGDDLGLLARSERSGWQAFVRLLEEAKKSENLFNRRRQSLSLNQFRKQISEILAGQTWDENDSEEGKVRVVNAEQVRALEVPHLFLCGLNEGEFPTSRNEDCFLSENDRQRLIDYGLPLGHRARHGREEMLLFYGVVTRARESLTLSYSSLNDSGETLNRSPFLTAVLELIDERELPIEQCGSLDPIPLDASQCAAAADLRIYAMAQALEGKGGLFATASERSDIGRTYRSIAAAVDMASARFKTAGLTEYEGLLTDLRNLKRLRQRFGPRHEFSVTELEAYASNPFRFFLLNVLGLDEPSVPGPRTNFARRGSELHSVLAKCHQEFSDRDPTAYDDGFGMLLRSEITHRAAFVTDSALHRVLRDLEREVLLKLADRYLGQWQKYLEQFHGLWDRCPRPTYLEIPFGNAPPEEGTRDVQERQNPVVEFGRDGERVRLRGRIDRIDVGSANGRTVYTVVDYKLSRRPPRFSLEDVRNGFSLQLPVYAIAVQRLGVIDGELFQFGFWSLAGDGFALGLKSGSKKLGSVDGNVAKEMEEQLDQLMPQLVSRIRDGMFAVVEDDTDQYHPDCAAVARVTSLRPLMDVLEKRLPPIASFLAHGSA